jgi:hypothetical protein
MLGEVAGAEPIVCVDGAYRPAEGAAGARLFTEEGEDTPLLVERIRLMNEYYAAAKATDVFIKTLNDLGLFRPIAIDARFQSGESIALNGLMVVDEQKLNSLPDEDFLRLRKEGLLAPIYAHLISLAKIDEIRRLS